MVQMFMWYLKKVFALWSVHFRVSALEKFCYKGFLTNSSGTKFFVRLRVVSALEDVCFREVPLYFIFHHCRFRYTETWNDSICLSEQNFLATISVIKT